MQRRQGEEAAWSSSKAGALDQRMLVFCSQKRSRWRGLFILSRTLLSECSNDIWLVAWQLHKVPIVHFQDSGICGMTSRRTQTRMINPRYDCNLKEFALALENGRPPFAPKIYFRHSVLVNDLMHADVPHTKTA